jgi:hypothetical protein
VEALLNLLPEIGYGTICHHNRAGNGKMILPSGSTGTVRG